MSAVPGLTGTLDIGAFVGSELVQQTSLERSNGLAEAWEEVVRAYRLFVPEEPPL